MPLLELIGKNKAKYKDRHTKKQSLSATNNDEVCIALNEVDLEKVAEYFVNGRLNLKLAFMGLYRGATIWHILALNNSPAGTQLLNEMLELYKRTYGYNACPEELNMYEVSGQTPIHYAALAGNTEGMRILVEHGADPTKLTENNTDTIIDFLKLKRHESLIPTAKEIIENYQSGKYQKPHPIDEFIAQGEAEKDKALKAGKNSSSADSFSFTQCFKGLKSFFISNKVTPGKINTADEETLLDKHSHNFSHDQKLKPH